ncbi:protein phosphatase 2C domain-containing protein [Paenibacillus sp. HB172176]|uniref:protein phosphatase 2C domain-containing protein n=1 Tax=Paenibacillus sp. HB172176 TaxID=2493690 RepID=UPI00143C1834|nr:protein phosphatase 2C domain-containing protein [Paenibacillus sp. HB172176]
MEFEWIGSEQKYLDEIFITSLGHIQIGCFGGSTKVGALKNEDAIYCIQSLEKNWVFAVLLDAHNSSESAKIVIEVLKDNRDEIIEICNSENVFKDLEPYIVSILSEEPFRNQCRTINGETSCLFIFQKGAFIWWLSIGDCMGYLFHPELAKFHQYGLNQRQFFEWIGQVNTFDLQVPCYSSGRRQLRQGVNLILLSTDGLLDCENGKYQSSCNLYNSFVNEQEIHKNLRMVLEDIMNDHVKDSTSLICWQVNNSHQVLYPSD